MILQGKSDLFGKHITDCSLQSDHYDDDCADDVNDDDDKR